MGNSTSLQQRLEILERARAGESDATIAAALSISRWTVRKWRRRGQRLGRSGLVSQLGRPSLGALSSFDPVLAEWVRQQRVAHPRWGPRTLLSEMRQAPSLVGLRLPGRSQIAAFLKEQHLIRPYAQHTTLQQPDPTQPVHAHQEWELDAQGAQSVAAVDVVVVINVLDRYSRVKVESCACTGSTKASTADYQLACRRAFLRFGRPEQLSLDHDTIFWDSHAPSPYPTRLHLWLLALDIKVRFIHRPPPQEHSQIERMHQVMTQQALAGQVLPNSTAIQHSLDARRYALNRHYPTTEQAPLQRHPQAHHSGRPYTPETEADILDLARVHTYLAQHHWFRQVSSVGQFSLGGYRYGLGKRAANQEIEITFDATTQQFVCSTTDDDCFARLAPQGLTKLDLMGESVPWLRLPAYQRRLPLFPGACREARFFQELNGMTL